MHDRDGRQVRRPDRVLQEPERGALPRRLRAPRARARSSTSTPRSSTTRRCSRTCDGILVPHGFGARGAEGKIAAVRYAREQRDPVLRHLLRHADRGDRVRAQRRRASRAPTRPRSIPKTPHPVIDLLPEQRARRRARARRCGSAPSPACCARAPRAFAPTAASEIAERHRHRYEFNPDYRERLEQAGLVLSGTSPDGRLVEIVELEDHPWFVGCQFHPEFESTPVPPAPALRRLRRGGGAQQRVRQRLSAPAEAARGRRARLARRPRLS